MGRQGPEAFFERLKVGAIAVGKKFQLAVQGEEQAEGWGVERPLLPGPGENAGRRRHKDLIAGGSSHYPFGQPPLLPGAFRGESPRGKRPGQ